MRDTAWFEKLEHLFSLNCLQCALNQAISTSSHVGLSEPERRRLVQTALERIARDGIDRNNCELIDQAYRVVTDYVGDQDPYRELKLYYDREMYALCPQLRTHIAQSDDPLRAAVLLSIAGNLIDLAAHGHEVSLERVREKLASIERDGFCIDDLESLRARLADARTLMVLGDNCGEIAMDRLLIETLRTLYPALEIQYGVRGAPAVNDVTIEDAQAVEMQDVAEVIDNGDNRLSTLLNRTSPAFNARFYAADVIIAKGMGNFEGLHCCDRGDIWFLMIAKCDAVAERAGAPRGSVLCLHKKD